MSKNLNKRLRELQRVAALHQNQPVAPIGVPVLSNTPTSTSSTAVAAIGTPEHYKVIRKDLIFVVILMAITVALLFGLDWVVNNTGLADWIVRLGTVIR